MAGLQNANLRLNALAEADPSLPDIMVQLDPDEPGDEDVKDEGGNVIEIKHGDGSVTVSLDGNPIEEAKKREKNKKWFDNLCDEIDDDELSRISDDLLRGIDQDLRSREEWIQDRAQGIKLLGLKVELPNQQGAVDSAPVEGMSKVRHPLLLEAVLRFQANARSELLPTDGPVKIRNDSNDDTLKNDLIANAYERDMNHYLTAVATEYYPDTDRLLLLTGFGGTGFKKVYKCPLRNRPVSESVDADDLIVNMSATDLSNARRITHRIFMRASTVKRLQILEVYRDDIDLGDPMPRKPDAQDEEEKSQQGLTPDNTVYPKDRDREIYETCCELDVKGFEHKLNGKASGLEIPYKVTIDVSSKQILSITRNYKKSEKLPTALKLYVKYPFVPGFGFYDIGLLHILGNTTNAVTAAWREMLDSGMYANFPGFLQSDSVGRQNTNVFRIPPGGGQTIKTNGLPLKDAVMPLPYNTQGMPALMSLTENMVETGQRVGGTAELQVGEGRESQPVGTTMALIDQAIKIMSSVHKRLHAAQAEEFKMIIDVFKENPESFWMRGCPSKTEWDVQKFLQAANDCDLVPVADPNTASKGERLMKVTGLVQLQISFPSLIDPLAVIKAALTSMGWDHPEQFLVPPEAQAQPPPQLVQQQQETAAKTKTADAKAQEAQAALIEAQAKAAESKNKIDLGHFAPKGEAAPEMPEQESQLDIAMAMAKVRDSETKAKETQLKAHELLIENTNRDKDREAKQTDAAIGLAKELLKPVPAGGGAGPDGKPKPKPKVPNPAKVAKTTKAIIDEVKPKGVDSGNE